MFPNTANDDTVSSMKNSSLDMKDDLQSIANQAGRKIRGIFNATSEDISQASDKITTEIRSNPVRSAGIALGVGLLLGALLRR